MKAVILAAGMGSRLAPLTLDRPKPLVPVAGRPLLFRLIDRLAEAGVRGRDVVVVGGYREDELRRALAAERLEAQVVTNPKYDVWNNFWSLAVAREAIGEDSFLQVDGDMLIDGEVLRRLLAAPGPGAVAVDVRPNLDAETMKVAVEGPDRRIVAFSKALDPATALGESVGIARIDAALAPRLFDDLAAMAHEGLTGEYYEHSYQRLARRGEGPFRAVDVHGCLAVEIDDLEDLRRAEALVVQVKS